MSRWAVSRSSGSGVSSSIGRHTINTATTVDVTENLHSNIRNRMTDSSGLRRGQAEPGQPPGAAQVDAFEDGGHLGGGDLDVAVLASGKRNVPFSSRLYQIAKPSRSQ